jgi:hypothetical protein
MTTPVRLSTASEGLWHVAQHAHIILTSARKYQNGVAGKIATQLLYIRNTPLEDLNELPDSIERLCLRALQDLLDICQVCVSLIPKIPRRLAEISLT